MKPKKGIFAVIGILAVAAIFAALLWYFHIPQAYRAYCLVRDVWSGDARQFDMSMTIDTGDGPLELSGGLSWTDAAETRIFCLESGNIRLYFADNALYFDNGKAYRLTENSNIKTNTPLEFMTFLKTTMITEHDGVYRISGPESDSETFSLCLMSQEGSFYSAELSVLAVLDENPVSLSFSLTSNDEVPAAIPDPVLRAISSNSGSSEPLTTSLLRLWSAGIQLTQAETIGADVTWNVSGAKLGLGDSFTFYKTGDSCAIGKNSFVKFEIDSPQNSAQNAMTALPQILYTVLANSDVASTGVGETYIYTVSLSAEDMESICYTLAPELETLWITFLDGTFQLTLDGSTLDAVLIQCNGSIDAMLTSIPVGVSLEANMIDHPVFPE